MQFLSGDTYRGLAERIGCHPETLRRYLVFGLPRLDVLRGLHDQGFSIDWALSGYRSMRLAEHPRPLPDIPTEELLLEIARRQAAVAARVDALQARIDRIQHRDPGTAPDPLADGTTTTFKFAPPPAREEKDNRKTPKQRGG